MIISLLIVAALPFTLTTVVNAAPPEQGWHDAANCPPNIIENAYDGTYLGTAYDCCWTETEEGDPEQIEIYKCQWCYVPASASGKEMICEPSRPGSTAPATTGGNIVLGDIGVLEQPPTPPQFDPTAPLQGGVLEQLQNDQPPLFGRNVPLQGFGVLGQQPAAIVPPSPVLTPVPPVLTPEPPVPMFGSTQQAPETPPMFGQIAPEGQVLQPLTPAQGEGGEQAQSSAVSPTGYCASSIRTSCIPCDPGLPVADCTPAGEWPPVLSAGEGLAQGTQPPLKTAPPLGEIVPEAGQPEVEEQDEEPQDDGQEEPSNEEQETAGPLT